MEVVDRSRYFYLFSELVAREAQYFERLVSEPVFQFIESNILETTFQMMINKSKTLLD